MKILLLSSSFNGFTQRVYKTLLRKGYFLPNQQSRYKVGVTTFQTPELLQKQVDFVKPDVILSPFLKEKIPEEVFLKYKCLISHPGPQGDRGPSSIDWALFEGQTQWGATVIQASEEIDGGHIYSTKPFKIESGESDTKSKVYNVDYQDYALEAIIDSLTKIGQGIPPKSLELNDPLTIGKFRPLLTKEVRAIVWEKDNLEDILRKIKSSDGFPGANAVVHGRTFKLFGAYKAAFGKDSYISSQNIPGSIIAHSNNALCFRTVCGSSFWVKYMKEVNEEAPFSTFKLPAKLLIHAPEEIPDLSLHSDGYSDVSLTQNASVGYLKFDCYNGAMDTDFCKRLLAKLKEASNLKLTHLVIEGGYPFSYGINLNTIEKASDPEQEAWQNLLCINDVVKEILSLKSTITIASLKGNAGAGGVALAAACDLVVASSSTLLNPHYQRMGLYGSEYWTYSFARRMGKEMALKVTEQCLPLLAEEALELGLVDLVCERSKLKEFIFSEVAIPELYNSQMEKKLQQIQKLERPLEEYRNEELEMMKKCIFENIWEFREKRKAFVYKHCNQPLNPLVYPTWQRDEKNNLKKQYSHKIIDGIKLGKQLEQAVHKELNEFKEQNGIKRGPGLTIIQVGERTDSSIYINKKKEACERLGIIPQIIQLPDSVTQSEMEEIIQKLNQNDDVDGVLIQLPIPNHLSAATLNLMISPVKNIEGLKFTEDQENMYLDVLAFACKTIIESQALDLTKLKVAVIGKGIVAGDPIYYWISKFAAETVWLQPYEVQPDTLKQTDLIIIGARAPRLIKSSMIKEGCVIIDVGINQEEHEFGNLTGDADFEDCIHKVKAMTPVPGGVGPITVSSLIHNTVKAFENRNKDLQHAKQ